MISKTLLATFLCFLVILTAIGAYGYVTVIDLSNQVNSLKDTVSSLEEERTALQNNISTLEDERDTFQNNVSALESALESLQNNISNLESQIDELQNTINTLNATADYIFQFPSGLRMELNFSWIGKNLSIVAKINDLQCQPGAGFGLCTDTSQDGEITAGEGAMLLYADNYYHTGPLSKEGYMWIPLMIPSPSLYHTCIFEPEVGYIYNILLPNEKDYIINSLIHIFWIGPSYMDWVQFDFASGVQL